MKRIDEMKETIWKKDRSDTCGVGHTSTLRSRRFCVKIHGFFNEDTSEDHVRVVNRVESLSCVLKDFLTNEPNFGNEVELKLENERLQNELKNFKWYNTLQLIGACLGGAVLFAGLQYGWNLIH